MPKNKGPGAGRNGEPSVNPEDGGSTSSPVDEMLLAALARGDDNLETGRYLVTFKENAAQEGIQSLGELGLRVADVRDFKNQAATLEDMSGADTVVFPEIGVALVESAPAQERGIGIKSEIQSDSPIESIDPEYFMFALRGSNGYGTGGQATLTDPREQLLGYPGAVKGGPSEYLRGFARAAEAIAHDLAEVEQPEVDELEEALVLGATWGLNACRVSASARSGVGIRVAVLDTGMDLGHPDFVARPITRVSFVGQPVQDLHGHGTHCIGTATGPKAPPGTTPRYGIAYKSSIFVGKVLTNSGTGTQAGILAGINWAIANQCALISMSLGAPIGVHPAYTAAGAAALARGCLMVAAAGNTGGPTGAPANSPTVMAVASLDNNLQPSAFSSHGKIDIAAPGRDVFSSWPRPLRYRTISGTSMATPHVAGCGAFWAETSNALRGINLWRRLQVTARRLPFPGSRVGAGLVQAP